MKSLKSIFSLAICSLFISSTFAQLSDSDVETQSGIDKASAKSIVQSYVNDYKMDRFASEAMLFGVEVPEHGSWTIHVTGNQIGSDWEVTLNEGLPETPTFIYVIEFETLQAIDEGKINALTAQGKAFAGDYTPMSIKQMDGYEPSMEAYAKINPFSFHFWTRGFPEIVPFGEGMTRRAHGSNFTVFYYETGLRTAWYRVLPEERVRDDAREQAAPFPMLIVAIKGTTEGEVDGKRVSLEKGNTIFIPAGVAHKWWNETDEATEAILIMFGKGA